MTVSGPQDGEGTKDWDAMGSSVARGASQCLNAIVMAPRAPRKSARKRFDEPRLQLARSTHAVMKLVVAVLALFATANAFTVPAAPRTIAAPRTSSPVAVVSDEKTDAGLHPLRAGKYLSSNPSRRLQGADAALYAARRAQRVILFLLLCACVLCRRHLLGQPLLHPRLSIIPSAL